MTQGVETIISLQGKPVSKDDPRAVAADGRMSGTLIIHTDVMEMPKVEVPISYMIRM